MDAQLPDSDASARRTGAQPPGQASAFRRALDKQVEPTDPAMALVPAGPHDLTAPLDLAPLRAVLADDAPTVRVPRTRAATRDETPAATTGNGNDSGGSGDGPDDKSPDDDGAGTGKSSRLPTTVGVSAALAAIAGAALVLINLGHSDAPLAPTAMPTRTVTSPSPSPQSAHAGAPTHKASVSASPGRSATATPGRMAGPSASATPGGTAGGKAGGGAGPESSSIANFQTIYWTNDSEPIVADIQQRLTKLGYLSIDRSGTQYLVTEKTAKAVGWRPGNPDDSGYYQNTTNVAIRAFEYDYLQHDQGQLPGDGCSSQTYQALVKASN